MDGLPGVHVKKRSKPSTVLVIDDEESVLMVISDMLEKVGFSVLTALDGEDGVTSFEKNAKVINAILLDLSLPTSEAPGPF